MSAVPSSPPDFPKAPGQMSAKVRQYDWHRHPLGPMEQWPLALRMALESMLANRIAACLMWGPQQFLFYNDAYGAILGEKPEALGRPCSEVWGEIWPTILPIVESAYAGDSTFIEDYELQINRYGVSEQAFFTFCYSPLRDEHGHVVGLLDTVLETTGKVIAERRLRDQNMSLETQVAARTADRNRLWHSAEALLIVLRFDGVIVTVNPAWTAALGWSEEETVGRHILSFAHSDETGNILSELGSLRSGAERSQTTQRYRHRSGADRWIAWTAVPAEGFIQGVGRDVTQERAQVEALHDAEERLRQSQKMEAVGQLTGGIAHDLNNMLQGVVLPLQLIRQRMAQQRYGDIGRYVEAGLSAAKRAGSLTQRLLAFSRRQPLASRAVDLGESLQGLEPVLRTTCGENIGLTMDVDAYCWRALTDAHQFESAILNLAINARDAMPAGGQIRISVRNCSLGSQQAGLHEGLEPGDYVCVTVADTGMGMPRDVIDRAFDPFFTTKPIGQGTGLGLSMIYGYMRQTGGMAVIDSTVGEGTRVHLYFVRTEASLDQPAQDFLDSQPADKRPDSTLVVEDDETVRSLAVELLRDMGFQVMQAASGTEAMALLSGALHFDLLLSDVGLPGPNGRQVADFAREKLPGIRVILMTGYAEQAAMNPNFLGAQMELLVKPFDAQALVAKVRTVMGALAPPMPARFERDGGAEPDTISGGLYPHP
ncbi:MULTISPECIES: ATP-binding protein [unclassified Acidovorax]|uniref:hybrid sensor histidine kinase/response regulator n=1 Tax=unclassified Acidovorax TaxID=2684926 RepID=UPI0028834B5F|nr:MULTISPECIES: ATP-binding protein [unclassified Acidovorax]